MNGMMKLTVAVALVSGLLAGCGEEESKPYFTFAGGGFIFNYRNADAYYGFVLKPVRTTPEGAELEVDFELPQLGQHDIQRIRLREGQLQYAFRSPDLSNIKRNHPYKVVVRVLSDGIELASYTKTFATDIDQSSLPREPLVVGPGYQPNPELSQ